jgi:hypothetical protein
MAVEHTGTRQQQRVGDQHTCYIYIYCRQRARVAEANHVELFIHVLENVDGGGRRESCII